MWTSHWRRRSAAHSPVDAKTPPGCDGRGAFRFRSVVNLHAGCDSQDAHQAATLAVYG